MARMERAILERKLRIRSWRRGTREMDLLLGGFADSHLAGLREAELAAFAGLLDRGDPEIEDILMQRRPAGVHARIAGAIRRHHRMGPVLRPDAGGAVRGGRG